jgi:hypothetical protein
VKGGVKGGEMKGDGRRSCNSMAFPAPGMNYRYLTPRVTCCGYLGQITTSLDF